VIWDGVIGKWNGNERWEGNMRWSARKCYGTVGWEKDLDRGKKGWERSLGEMYTVWVDWKVGWEIDIRGRDGRVG